MIRIDSLSFSYGEKQVFSEFTAEIGDGVTCLSAPSGFGKTTLLRLMAGLETPNGGSITGVPDGVSYMFQEDRLLPWLTARENVAAVLPRHRQDEAAKFLELTELGAELDKLPKNLSGGQCRRIALARAIAFGGELLLLDEPFKGLDTSLVERLAPKIARLFPMIIMSSHSMHEAELMGGKILYLENHQSGTR